MNIENEDIDKFREEFNHFKSKRNFFTKES